MQLGPVEVVIVTSLVETAQLPFEIVHLKVAVDPKFNPVTPDVAEVGVVIVAVPETTDQEPLPLIGVFPAKVDVVAHAANV